MKRIGKTDNGGVLVEMTNSDVVRLMEACQALDQLFGEIEVSIEPACGTGAFLGDAVRNSVYTTPPAVVKAIKKEVLKDVVDKPARDRTPFPPGTTKACAHCGKTFEPPRKDSRFCSKSCSDKAWRADKKMSKPRAARTKKTIKYPPKTCVNCKKTFDPVRHDQTCCSRACRAKTPRTTYPKYDAEAAKAARLAKIKELDQRKRSTFKPTADSISLEDTAEFKQAQREASAE